MLFHMVASVLFSMAALSTAIAKILIGCWRIFTNQRMVEKATMESKTEATMWKSIKNWIRKWCHKWVYILFGVIYRKNKQWSWLYCRMTMNCIHVKERNAIFPFPESCPFFSESERKAGLIWKGWKGMGKERYDGAKFPFLSISDFPIWKTKFSISLKKVIKLRGHFLEFCITSNGRALVGALVGVMEGNFYHAKLTW